MEAEEGRMADDERPEGEVEKKENVVYRCDCGKEYKYSHKLEHHRTWICKERAPNLMQVNSRRELSSNIYVMSTIPECEDGKKTEEVVGEESDILGQRIKCELCSKTFAGKNSVRNHKRNFHKVRSFVSEVGIIFPVSLAFIKVTSLRRGTSTKLQLKTCHPAGKHSRCHVKS